MECLADAHGELVFIDTAPFIYLIEEHPRYLPVVKPLFESLDRGELRAVTSVITLLEAIVHPLRMPDSILASTYLEVFQSASGLDLWTVGPNVAVEAASLRATNPSLRAPDAIQLSVARLAGASLFITNDRRLAGLSDLRTIVVEDWVERTA